MQQSIYSFGVLDPRPIPAAQTHNDALLGEKTLGIEVTVPGLAARCGLGNLDPQHSPGGNSSLAAIEVARSVALPEPGSRLVTVRADLDSIASMALLELRASGGLSLPEGLAADVIRRIADIAKVDTFSSGQWQGKTALPSAEHRWPEIESGLNTRELIGMAALVADHKLPVDERVSLMRDYLVSGAVPAKYFDQVEKERTDLIGALENGAISVRTEKLGDIEVAVVESTHRAALMIGYTQAPVVLAINPTFPVPGAEPVKKMTLCQLTAGYVDLGKIKGELSALEAGWGGSPTIIGSPQGVSTTLTTEQVLQVMKNNTVIH